MYSYPSRIQFKMRDYMKKYPLTGHLTKYNTWMTSYWKIIKTFRNIFLTMF